MRGRDAERLAGRAFERLVAVFLAVVAEHHRAQRDAEPHAQQRRDDLDEAPRHVVLLDKRAGDERRIAAVQRVDRAHVWILSPAVQRFARDQFGLAHELEPTRQRHGRQVRARQPLRLVAARGDEARRDEPQMRHQVVLIVQAGRVEPRIVRGACAGRAGKRVEHQVDGCQRERCRAAEVFELDAQQREMEVGFDLRVERIVVRVEQRARGGGPVEVQPQHRSVARDRVAPRGVERGQAGDDRLRDARVDPRGLRGERIGGRVVGLANQRMRVEKRAERVPAGVGFAFAQRPPQRRRRVGQAVELRGDLVRGVAGVERQPVFVRARAHADERRAGLVVNRVDDEARRLITLKCPEIHGDPQWKMRGSGALSSA
ncbi:hypothetical protein QFZ94_008480 [Paraburkholderia sp. JPY465]|uniref:hypothetical protein n=1 Tax=Paraburkholderia sp. JPY465 TaxID=3042285 RepID=UPI003D1CCDDF